MMNIIFVYKSELGDYDIPAGFDMQTAWATFEQEVINSFTCNWSLLAVQMLTDRPGLRIHPSSSSVLPNKLGLYCVVHPG